MRTFLKWTGSKRLQADFILDKFPKEIDTYYEPFLGSGSIMMRLLETDIPVNNIVASDVCEPLIGLWKEVQTNPQSIIDTYRSLHKEFVKDRKTVFNEVRKTFNEDKTNYGHFLFLTRTCINGLIRLLIAGKEQDLALQKDPAGSRLVKPIVKVVTAVALAVGDTRIVYAVAECTVGTDKVKAGGLGRLTGRRANALAVTHAVPKEI